ncbi:hypothetical protein EVAR_96239_1 [Eumeta japonica]|uniref:Uncharacterized protein n=1 Tax=Eumeta variegata TaxID=151549 RepID=A0A4C1WKU6_EUMVA|nr:hypothetical protein EVAR_96239_1 [Eumeta japonica]
MNHQQKYHDQESDKVFPAETAAPIFRHHFRGHAMRSHLIVAGIDYTSIVTIELIDYCRISSAGARGGGGRQVARHPVADLYFRIGHGVRPAGSMSRSEVTAPKKQPAGVAAAAASRRC